MSESGAEDPKAVLTAFLSAQKPANKDLASHRQADQLRIKEEEARRLLTIDKALKDLTGKKDLAEFLAARGVEGVLVPGQPAGNQDTAPPLLAVRGDGSIVLRVPGQPELSFRMMDIEGSTSDSTGSYDGTAVIKDGERERYSMVRVDRSSVERNPDYLSGRKTEGDRARARALVGMDSHDLFADHMSKLPADLTGKTIYSNLHSHLSTLAQPPAPAA